MKPSSATSSCPWITTGSISHSIFTCPDASITQIGTFPADQSARGKSGQRAARRRSGLIVMYELRTSERILTRPVLKDLEFDKSIRPGRFHYAPPEGVSVLDHDAAIVRELDQP